MEISNSTLSRSSHNWMRRFDRIVSIVLLISPIIMTYGWGKYDFAFILTSLLAIFSVVIKGFNLKVVPRAMLIYFLYWLVVHVITASSTSELFSLGIIRAFLCFLMFFSIEENDFFLKCYRIICGVSILFFFFQVITFFLFEYRVSGVSTVLPLALDIEASEYFGKVQYGERSSSFFSEPAAFVEYILPLLCIELFRSRKINWFMVATIIAALLLTESGTALVGMAAVALMYLVKVVSNSRQLLGKAFLLLFVSIIFVFAIYKYSETEIGQRLIERQDQLDSTGSSDAQSGFVRIYRGFYVFDSFSPMEKILGNDSPARIKEKISATNLFVSNGMSDEMYFNTIQTALIRTGYIGLVLFLCMLMSLYRHSDYCRKAIFVVFFFLSFISFAHFTEGMAIYLLLALNKKKAFA